MKVRPVESTPAPGYPDKYADETRKALAAARPQRWLAAPVAAGLAATVALGLSGCGKEEFVTAGDPTQIPTEVTLVSGIPYSTEYYTEYIIDGETTTAPTTIPITSTTTGASKSTQPKTDVLDPDFVTLGIPMSVPVTMGQEIALPKGVVPLFEYGEGIGSFGCVSVAAPYFISEDEAFAILQAAFAEAGVTLEQGGQEIKRATLPVTDRFSFAGEDKALKTTRGTLTPDGMVGGIPVEFVSVSDVNDWEKKQDGMWVSVEQFATKDAAAVLAGKNPGLVVFYDPVTIYDVWGEGERYGMGEGWAKSAEEAKAQSEQQLRLQVQAFVQWMNAEGAR